MRAQIQTTGWTLMMTTRVAMMDSVQVGEQGQAAAAAGAWTHALPLQMRCGRPCAGEWRSS